jgi:hypothetical protein
MLTDARRRGRRVIPHGRPRLCVVLIGPWLPGRAAWLSHQQHLNTLRADVAGPARR